MIVVTKGAYAYWEKTSLTLQVEVHISSGQNETVSSTFDSPGITPICEYVSVNNKKTKLTFQWVYLKIWVRGKNNYFKFKRKWYHISEFIRFLEPVNVAILVSTPSEGRTYSSEIGQIPKSMWRGNMDFGLVMMTSFITGKASNVISRVSSWSELMRRESA